MVEASWVLIGPGIQLAQMIGVHRSGFGKGRDPKEVELWKRAFWQLFILDTALSMGLGRPISSSANDLDLELPAMCDDEYWETPNPDDAFKQPDNTPSKLVFWVHLIKLMEIVGFTQRSIYSARHLDPWGPSTLSAEEWNRKAVMELDSALNKWIHALPDFLKYDPHRKDSVFARQSTVLYAEFYWARIQVHKHFISRIDRESIPTSHPLVICANAARSCIHLIDDYHQRFKIKLTYFIPRIFTCATTLCINLWRGIQSQISSNAAGEMNNIQKCLDLLALYEDRFEIAGRLRDILLSVISVSQLPPVEQPPPSKNTHRFYEESPLPSDFIEDECRLNAGSQQRARSQYNTSTDASFNSFNHGLNPDYSLPVSNDFGGMPVHIDIDPDMVAPFDSLNGMAFEFDPGQLMNRTSSSQVEWSQFMAEVDELLQLVNYPVAGHYM
ncbi:hypothetical protein GYMLUDRAFT_47749 [Collybiopsis luxurians FD-317 M1]|uniref:Unplaced genomic scaffold GYMLUscaffold_57, whole genome shotgun sequence n=1 Tax=Collybiopsis luxurians FD-317 M1 TaxID=944289 RepID=A0A0D0CBV5_9AGAR|nr:hypothetical protein GYMLUDRAFT_47749 [Collybiopsis luxurians FD-317 M1]